MIDMDELIYHVSKLVSQDKSFDQAIKEASNLLQEEYRQPFLIIASTVRLHEDPVWGLWFLMERGELTEEKLALLAEKS